MVATLQELLLVEDDPSILEFVCPSTRMPLWPQIRVVFLRMMMADLLYGAPLTGQSRSSSSPGRALVALGQSIVHNARLRATGECRAQVCITADGVGDQWVAGKRFNRLVDHFATQGPPTLVMADLFEWRWPFPRHHERLLLHAPQQARNRLVGNLMVRDSHRANARKLVRIVKQRAYRHLNWTLDELRERRLVRMLSHKSASLPSQYAAYSALMERVRPRVLLVGGACYGPMASLVAAAKALGIVTAEYQHGAVMSGHDAYNFAPTIAASPDYRRTLPDHFLGYGRWWNEQISAPVAKVSIGSPHRDSQLASIRRSPAEKSDVLILSDGIDFPLYLELAKQIDVWARGRGLRVVLRPHPLERTWVRSTHGEAHERIRFDLAENLYDSLLTAHAVVSEISTGVFEAVGLADRLFVWDTPKSRFTVPNHPFGSFSSAHELTELLDAGAAGRVDAADVEALWAPGWQENYSGFLQAYADGPSKQARLAQR